MIVVGIIIVYDRIHKGMVTPYNRSSKIPFFFQKTAREARLFFNIGENLNLIVARKKNSKVF